MTTPFEERTPVTLLNQGQKIFAVLHRPLDNRKTPAVVFAHGFAGNKIGHKRRYVQQAEALVKQGVAVLRIDFRGCGDSEGTFGEVTVRGLVSDLLTALHYVSQLNTVDPSRIGILGSSLGGSIAILTAAQFPIKSLALWAPVAIGQLWLEDWERAYPQEVVANHIRCGGETAGEQFRHEFLQMRADEELKKLSHLPLFHAHGDQDRVVFPHHATVFREARGNHQPSQFLRLPKSNHQFGNAEEESALLIEQTTQWFKNTL